jgi:hypothetical protein
MIHLQQRRFQIPTLHITRTQFTHCSGLKPLTLKQESIVADLAGLFFANFTLIALLNHLTKLSVGQNTSYKSRVINEQETVCALLASLTQLQRGLLHRHSSGRTEERHENLTDASTFPDRARTPLWGKSEVSLSSSFIRSLIRRHFDYSSAVHPQTSTKNV